MTTDVKTEPPQTDAIERGTYEILRGRLAEQARILGSKAEGLNAERLEIFGGTEMTVIGNERIRTANNCVPRDIRPAGDSLLFGYNVFLGLKTETHVEDVLSLHGFEERDGVPPEGGERNNYPGGGQTQQFAFDSVGGEESFLAEPTFVKEFKELYKYYKDTRLLQLRRVEGKLLAVFQTGAALHDVKVFRWAVDPDGGVTYIDNRGERDHVFPSSHGFEWTATAREHHVPGRHPHVSVLDEVFVETVGGDLTVKVEDNTEDGLGIYREPVDEPDQSLDDAEIHYAKVGTLILLKILPYNESDWRYLVFNTRSHQVDRIDAIGQACLLLPEDHGLIFPGGYYLQSGETKTFEGDVSQMELLETRRSPNGEDVIYVFHERQVGRSILLPYNMIRKQVQNPIHCHGYSFFGDGRLVVFRAVSEEPTRVHPMQIWQTPFTSDEHAAQAPQQGTFLEKIGNADLVRGISEALSIRRMIDALAEPGEEPGATVYEDLIGACVRMSDAHYWLDREEVSDLATTLAEVRSNGELILDEFEKVKAIRAQALAAVDAAEADLEELLAELGGEEMASVEVFVGALARLRTQRGHLITLAEMRYVDRGRLDALEARIVAEFDALSGRAVEFLSGEEALAPYHRQIEALAAGAETIDKASDGSPIRETLEGIGDGLELLTEVVGGLAIDDATVRTAILESISEVLGNLNRARALLDGRLRSLLETEAVAEFGAQFKLFGQSVAGAMALASGPEACDQQLSKLMLQLEELESRFGEFDQFAGQLATKREDVYEAFSSRKQALLDERQRRAGRMVEAAGRILTGIGRRAANFASSDELNTYFVADAMVAKVRDLAGKLRELQDSVKADELEMRLKSARDDAARALRDRQDIFEEGAEVIRLGRHRFSVNTQPFDLTLVPRSRFPRRGTSGGSRQGTGERRGERAMALHLTGTDFYQNVDDPEFAETRKFWDQLLVSETEDVYRGEYLAAAMLAGAEEEEGLTLQALHEAALAKGGLLEAVRGYAAERYDEGYERGLHDHDGALILEKLLALYATADLLRYAPRERSYACLFWAFYPEQSGRALWQRRARSLARLREAFARSPAIDQLCAELERAVAGFFGELELEVHPDDAHMAGRYLFEELAKEPQRFVTSAEAVRLRDAFLGSLDKAKNRSRLDDDLRELEDDLKNRYLLAAAWLRAFVDSTSEEGASELAPALDEAAVLLITERRLERATSSALSSLEVKDLLGQHPRITGRRLTLRLDEFLSRLTAFRQRRVPGFRRFQELRHELLGRQRQRLRLGEYMPKVMSSFVRNRLIDQVYLPLIGDNLAKQMGSLGAGKRTDQMGLLLLISPPGYGKTTLMEYVANRLGLVFVKVNGPALGHGVTSLDPTEAPNATSRQEVEKINFALEMANNVLLYLDDIQHTHPELLQKFISLCDAQRRIEGVWRGATSTYDLRGKRFAVCMAGNPYTESGEVFKIPDMLANRADTYNLGDILEGKDELFALSYLENSLTSNPVLAQLTTREPEDVYKLVRMAGGEELPPDQLAHGYSSVELEELLAVLRRLLRVQQVLLAVNQQYIYSASQDDAYRTEPPFQLQGSYRNMNKLAEKIVPVMNAAELEALIDDHYLGEAQTLTTGAEHNLLKLAELRDTISDEQQARWTEIKRGFARVQAMGGAEDDPAVRMLGQLGQMSDRLQDIGATIQAAGESARAPEVAEVAATTEMTEGPDLGESLSGALGPYLKTLQRYLGTLSKIAAQATEAGPTAAGKAAADPAAAAEVQAISRRLDGVVERIGELNQAASAGNAGVPPASAIDFTPYLDKLDATLKGLAEAPRGTEVVQTLDPGVYHVLAELAEAVGANLLPLVQDIGRRLKATPVAEDRALTRNIDRTLKRLDELKGLVVSLRKIDTRGLVAE